MDSAKTRTCTACFSEIDVRAKKCPLCRELQGMPRKLTIGSVLLVVVVLVGSLIWVDYWVYRKVGFESPNYAADIKIASSKLYFTPRTDGKSVSVVGELRHAGSQSVDYIVLEVRVSDRDGKLIDSFRSHIRERIEPGDEVSFKLPGYQVIHLPEAEYAAHTVIVRSAKLR